MSDFHTGDLNPIRTAPMLGAHKGAAGALVRPAAVKTLRRAVETAYPLSHPDFKDAYAVHECRMVDGIAVLPAPLP